MRIDLNNYEVVLFDYLEGNLSEEARAEVELFLAEHPQIAADVALISENWGEKLLPLSDEQVVFEDKESLYAVARKQSVSKLIYLPYVAAMAACLLLFLLFLKPEPENDTPSQHNTNEFAFTCLAEANKPDSVKTTRPARLLRDSAARNSPKMEPVCNDSLSESQRYKSLQHINPMQTPKTYLAIAMPDISLLSRDLANEQKTPSKANLRQERKAQRKSNIQALFAALRKTYVDPLKETLEEIPENFRQTFTSRQTLMSDTVYQAFWEGEPDF